MNEWGDMDIDDEIAYFTGRSKPKRRKASTGKRSVKYVGAGHTRVTYAHRVLDIHFDESQKEFNARQKARRKKAVKKAVKTRNATQGIADVRSVGGSLRYYNKKGKDITSRINRSQESGLAEIRHKELRTDRYSIEDMRALLRDDHWEEVCGHKKWNYDSNSTVKEFKKYLARTKNRR